MANEGDTGRLILAFNPDTKYSGADAISPEDLEGSIDAANGDLIIYRKLTDGSVKRLNPVGDIRDKIANLDASGVFDNAEAFVSNRKIYRFYFDSNRSTCRIDPELTFDTIYRYYAIREISLASDGSYVFVTGVKETDSNGIVKVISNLVDMNTQDSESGDGTKVSVPQVGGLIGTVNDGQDYMIEFYDVDRKLVNRISFQAIAVRASDLDLSPDMAITDLLVTTNRAVAGVDNACFLYRGESINNLELRMFLKYSDGRSRDVTYEQTTGGRLTVTGLTTISTDTVTPSNAADSAIQKFTITYQMIKTNSSADSSTTSSGSIIDPSSLTISKIIKVYIKEDVYADIDNIIVVGYVTEPVPGTKKINIKYFGHYSSGAVHDITNIIEYVSTPPVTGDAGIGVTQSLIIRVPYGNAGLYKNFNFTILATASNKYCIINGVNARFAIADATQNSNNQYSGKITGFKIYNETTQTMNSVDLVSLFALEKYTLDGATITPNYIRIRDTITSTYLYTGYISDPNLIYYVDNLLSGVGFYSDRPVLVEFVYLTINNGVAVDSFVTGALVHYIRFA